MDAAAVVEVVIAVGWRSGLMKGDIWVKAILMMEAAVVFKIVMSMG